MSLESYRNKIDRLDDAIAVLLSRRIEIVGELGEIKRRDGIPVRDEARERAVIERLTETLGTTESEFITAVYSAVFEYARSIQQPDGYYLIGSNVTHSLSPRIHSEAGNGKYIALSLTADEVTDFIKARKFKGINVTMPYKKTVIPYCDYLCPIAERLGVVNTLVNRDGRLYGYNTDYDGFKFMADSVGIDFDGKKVLILGDGATAHTACAVAVDGGAADTVMLSHAQIDAVTPIYTHTDSDIIINATPIDCKIELERFKNCSGVLDVQYNPLYSQTVIKARLNGIKADGGLTMLIKQAIRSEEIFFDAEKNSMDFDCLPRQYANIVLIGMPGAGKTSMGRLIAERLGRKFIDTDEEITKRMSKTPAELIESLGESAFRDIESEVIADISDMRDMVISLGGGAVMRQSNMLNIKKNGYIIYLRRELNNLDISNRPLSVKIAELFEKRRPLYEKYSDTVVDNNGEPSTTAENALKIKKILVINGPNLNLLGIREPQLYGTKNYSELSERIRLEGARLGISVRIFQSNIEGELVNAIQNARNIYDGIVINPAAYTHTSVAIADALKATGLRAVEVHLTDVDSREDFRRVSMTAPCCEKVIKGKGFEGYIEGIRYLINGAE